MIDSGFMSSLEREDPIFFWHNTQPRCPHCGEDVDPDPCNYPMLHDHVDGKHLIECDCCSRDFYVTTTFSVVFSTDDQSGLREE